MRIEPRPDDVLIVVDVQYDFLPGGALAVPDGDAVITPINGLAECFVHVVLTQDWHPPGHASFASSHPGKAPFETVELHYGTQVLWPDHCVQGTRGAEIAAELRIPHAKLIIRKGTHPAVDSYSGFLEADRITPTGLAGYLKERSHARVSCAALHDRAVQIVSLRQTCPAYSRPRLASLPNNGAQPSTRTYPHAGRGGRMTDGSHPSSKKSTEPSSMS